MERRQQASILLKIFVNHSENLISLQQKSVELYTIMSIGPNRFISLTILGYKTSSGDYRMTTPSPLPVWVSNEMSAMVYRTGIQSSKQEGIQNP